MAGACGVGAPHITQPKHDHSHIRWIARSPLQRHTAVSCRETQWGRVRYPPLFYKLTLTTPGGGGGGAGFRQAARPGSQLANASGGVLGRARRPKCDPSECPEHAPEAYSASGRVVSLFVNDTEVLCVSMDGFVLMSH